MISNSNDSFENHLDKLKEVLKCTQNAGLKINANKSFFCQAELQYLVYIKGNHNIVADGLSRLKPEPSLKSEPNFEVLDECKEHLLHEAFSLEYSSQETF